MIDFTLSVKDGGTQEPKEHRCVVRLTTTFYQGVRGLHTKKSLTLLKRKSFGYDMLNEDASAIGVEHVLNRIIGLHNMEDGVYEVVTCNHARDWETGYIDDWDYRLIPYDE
jgi:hypothetical protein